MSEVVDRLQSVFKRIIQRGGGKEGAKYCINCGYRLRGDEVFCPNCGYKLK